MNGLIGQLPEHMNKPQRPYTASLSFLGPDVLPPSRGCCPVSTRFIHLGNQEKYASKYVSKAIHQFFLL